MKRSRFSEEMGYSVLIARLTCLYPPANDVPLQLLRP